LYYPKKFQLVCGPRAAPLREVGWEAYWVVFGVPVSCEGASPTICRNGHSSSSSSARRDRPGAVERLLRPAQDKQEVSLFSPEGVLVVMVLTRLLLLLLMLPLLPPPLLLLLLILLLLPLILLLLMLQKEKKGRVGEWRCQRRRKQYWKEQC
jgi:hypothetical protein